MVNFMADANDGASIVDKRYLLAFQIPFDLVTLVAFAFSNYNLCNPGAGIFLTG